MKKAVFMDRDGTVIVDKHYLKSRDEVEFIPGSFEAVRLFRKEGFLVYILSNQSGVARGYFTEAEVRDVNDYIMEEMAGKNAPVDGIYYCPHHPEGTVPDYSFACDCRKPEPGMIKKMPEYGRIDLAGSYVIGDKRSDLLLAERIGSKAILVLTGKGEQYRESPAAFRVFPSLLEAARYIVKSA